ncbi:hypothetical protein D0T25_23720 [Duganella sp. BJB488]|uniref:hypothetical protein n=1 Tax=unclassified Duganella TaxID=2636909 RepID=UPI000E34A22F|nr:MULTISPECIES: hypothetical protein [unclassified Duganella]RFP09244.1 hypothetical protein D0T23_26400 [Duganella sp. BJB475]RFP13133.1 hypothetical protein D0T26_22830 [Duganella sp. BJB489]RFP17103.1 hypothetical protein D0T25_23720 [Duganella sp. BJB488]RFP25279.1 hypothetical protein D0T21_27430 [Duganella sp. BJB476]RFP31677.1 hypothetical protein D0T24_24995 [Duganella sp. BJB480]
MTYEFNSGDNTANDYPNPFKTENWFLLLSFLALTAGAVAILFDARTYFHDREDKVAAIAVILAATLFGIAIKFLIQALSQIRFYFGRKYPMGLADEVPANSYGLAKGGTDVIDMLRQGVVEFAEPQGPLNGVLYALIKPLITAPPPIQAAAVQHFHAGIAMTGILLSMAASYFFAAGTEYEGVISWMYLPMTGLSLLTPFMKSAAEDFNTQEVANSDKMLWKLIGLVTYAILAPVLVPRYLPALHVPPLWIAPLLLLTTSMVASVIFLVSLLSQLDNVEQTSVSVEQTTISMNCHPAQLWPKLSRDMQDSWVGGIPNRVYGNVIPGMTNSERASFQGYILEETQPSAFLNMSAESVSDKVGSRHRRYLIALGAWGLVLSVLAASVGAYYAPLFVDMQRMEILRVLLVVIALGVAMVLAFRIGHLLWSRMYFKSRLILVGIEGTFQTGEMRIGNQFSGNVQSHATVTRVQDATLRMWVSDIVTVSFGKAGKRFVMALAPADGFARATVSGLKEFAMSQSAVIAPTSTADVEVAKSIGRMNEALGPSFGGTILGASTGNRVLAPNTVQ